MVSPWMPCTPLRVCTPSQASQFGLALSLTSSALFQGQRILGDLTFTHTHPMHPRMPCTPLRVRASSPASQFWLAPSLMSSATNDFFNGPNILSTSFSMASHQQSMQSSANYCHTSKSVCQHGKSLTSGIQTWDYRMDQNSVSNKLRTVKAVVMDR